MIKQIIKKLIYYTYLSITAKMDFRHYRVLSMPYPVPQFSDNSGQQGNYCYGNWLAVKNAMGDSFDPHCMIEHGVYFGRVVLEKECTYPSISTIYTYSPYRKEVLNEYFNDSLGKEIVPVGPYVLFANHMMSERNRADLKKKWGKVLLVFPSHSSPEGKLAFDYNTWLKEIDERAKGFNTVVISIYWLDIFNGNYKHYLNKGYVLACCGNRFDPNFLSRQKDMISLADMTMSNDIGTHVGYSIALGRPHYIYHQKINMTYFENERTDTNDQGCNRKKEYSILFDAFSLFRPTITDEQKNLIKYFWGDF